MIVLSNSITDYVYVGEKRLVRFRCYNCAYKNSCGVGRLYSTNGKTVCAGRVLHILLNGNNHEYTINS